MENNINKTQSLKIQLVVCNVFQNIVVQLENIKNYTPPSPN